MSVLATAVDPRASAYLESRSIMLERLGQLTAALAPSADACASGQRDLRTQCGLSARQRVDLLVDRDTPLLELSPTAGLGTGYPAGAELVTAIGLVERSLCLIAADNPSAGEAPADQQRTAAHPLNPFTIVKAARAAEIARANALPLVHLMDGRGQPPTANIGSLFPDSATCHDLSGLSAERERDAIRSVRRALTRLTGRRRPAVAAASCHHADGPIHDQADLLALAPCEAHPAMFDPREILARVLDGSRFDEFEAFQRNEPHSGNGAPELRPGLCAGWGTVHGHPVALLADSVTAPDMDDLAQGIRFVQLADGASMPILIFLRGTGELPRAPGGRQHVQDAHASAPLLEAVAAARVPHLMVSLGATQRISDAPRFHFRWPTGIDSRETDDGTIDPRDTRTVLGLALAVIAHAGTGTRTWEPR